MSNIYFYILPSPYQKFRKLASCFKILPDTFTIIPMGKLISLKHRLLNKVENADNIFELFESGETVILGISGGKDSLCMVDLMFFYNEKTRKNLKFYGVYVDNGMGLLNEKEKEKIKAFLEKRDIVFNTINDDETLKSIKNKTKPFNPCFICARGRRKKLVEIAQKIGARKIALAHNLDDLVETLLLNILFAREISSFLPKQELFSGKFYIVRPLILIESRLTLEYARETSLPFIDNRCVYKDKNRRERIRGFIKELERDVPYIKKNILRAMMNYKKEFLWDKYAEYKKEILDL